MELLPDGKRGTHPAEGERLGDAELTPPTAQHLNNCGRFRAVREIPMPFEFVRRDELEFGYGNMEAASPPPRSPSRPGSRGALHRRTASQAGGVAASIEL